jgi:hypothetical protein
MVIKLLASVYALTAVVGLPIHHENVTVLITKLLPGLSLGYKSFLLLYMSVLMSALLLLSVIYIVELSFRYIESDKNLRLSQKNNTKT